MVWIDNNNAFDSLHNEWILKDLNISSYNKIPKKWKDDI